MKYFPEGIARGNAFINREEERNVLINRIKANQHTVLIAPRRYGKTSLVTRVSDEMKIPYCSIDLLAAYSEEYVRDQIVDKVSRLVFELLPRIKQAKEKLITIFKKMKPEISMGAFGQRLLLQLSNNPLKDVSEALLRLDETAKYFKKRAVVFLDEFQQISLIKNHHSIEASIRHAVERSENISYVFSGSNRHLLQQMFGDHGRPLYRLCYTMHIPRMTKEPYTQHLQALAKSKWKQFINEDTLNKIFELTEFHPFYMNILCQMVWENDHLPSVENVITIWDNYVRAQKHIIAHDITDISLNQRKIISSLAKLSTKTIQSIEFIAPIKLSPSSVKQAVDMLILKDLVYIDDTGMYRVLDPAMRYYLDVVVWD